VLSLVDEISKKVYHKKAQKKKMFRRWQKAASIWMI